MKLDQLIEYNKRKWGRETSSRPLFTFWKSLKWGKRKLSAVSFQNISIAFNLAYIKTKVCKTLDYWSRDMLNFNFSEKGLGPVSPRDSLYGFFFFLNQFLFNILPHDVIKPCSASDFTMGCPYNKQNNTIFCWLLPFEVYIVWNTKDWFLLLFYCHFFINNPSFSHLVCHSLLTNRILFQHMHLRSNRISLGGQNLLQ